ncbi:BTB/POZ domain-containing protein kctd6 [Trebouxia sp. C0009 RCD-2024]
MSTFNVLTLNVGGQLFTTTLQTLTSDPDSYFAKRFTGDFPAASLPDGTHFIDRDPHHFSKVLDFLRIGFCALPTLQDDRLGLLIEADFYGLEALRKLIGNEALSMYSAIVHRASVLAADPKVKEAVEHLRYFAYGTEYHAWALTRPVAIVIAYRQTDDQRVVYQATALGPSDTARLGKNLRGPAHMLSFSRSVFQEPTGRYGVCHKSASDMKGSYQSISCPPDHPKDLVSICQYSFRVIPLSADESKLALLTDYLRLHHEDMLLHLQRSYKDVAIEHMRFDDEERFIIHLRL